MDTDTTTLNTTLTTQAFYVLLALTERPLHGYGVRDQIARDSGSRLILAPGTIYGILRRLNKAALVERLEGPQPRYHLTDRGRLHLNDEARRLEHAVIDARQKLGTFKLPNH